MTKKEQFEQRYFEYMLSRLTFGKALIAKRRGNYNLTHKNFTKLEITAKTLNLLMEKLKNIIMLRVDSISDLDYFFKLWNS